MGQKSWTLGWQFLSGLLSLHSSTGMPSFIMGHKEHVLLPHAMHVLSPWSTVTLLSFIHLFPLCSPNSSPTQTFRSSEWWSPSGSLPWFSHTTSLEFNVYLSPTILQRHIGPNVVNSQLSSWTCLVVQWLRICLLMQETQVLSLIWEDPACSGATKPRCHSYYNPHLGPPPHSKRSHCDEPSTERKTQCNHRQISELST